MRYINILLIVLLGGAFAIGFNKVKNLIESWLGHDEKKEVVEILTATDAEPAIGTKTQSWYDGLIEKIVLEFNTDSHPTPDKQLIVYQLAELTAAELKYLVELFDVKTFKVGFGFFSKDMSLSLPKLLSMEYSNGLIGGTSGTKDQQVSLTRSFARIGVLLNFN